MSLTSYQAAPPCNKWEAEGPFRRYRCQRLFGKFPNSRLPVVVTGGLLTGSVSGWSPFKPNNHNRQNDRKAASSAGLCFARYIRSYEH